MSKRVRLAARVPVMLTGSTLVASAGVRGGAGTRAPSREAGGVGRPPGELRLDISPASPAHLPAMRAV